MRILMLDKNWLIDRRIALMIETLARDGHEFRIVHVQPPAHRWERTRIKGAQTVAIPLSDQSLAPVGDGIFPKPPHVHETDHPFGTDPRRRVTFTYDPTLPKAERWRRFVADPASAVSVLAASAWPPHLKYPAMAAFSLMDLPRRLSTLKPPADDFISARVVSPAGVPLDYWDKMTVRYAENVWRPDIVCANDYPALRAAVEIRKRIGASVVFDAHELYSYQPGVPHAAAKAIFREERILLEHVDALILVNEQHRQIVDRDSPFKGPIALCSNATTAPDGFDITRRYDWIRRKAPIPADHRIMLFQGGINVQRRIDFLLKGLAAARSRKVHQVFLTFGAEIAEFRRLADDLGIAGRVHFLPFVPWEEVLFWTASADCGMMPYQATDQNTAISSPNKMYEFILAGTPMIGSSDLVNVERIVAGEGFGVTRPLRTVADYAEAIDVMFDETLGGPERFRAALIARAAAYHWDAQIGGVVDLYRKVVDARAAGMRKAG